MNAARVNASFILLLCAALAAACERPSPQPSPAAVPAAPAGPPLKASDAACALPLGRFASNRRQLTGSVLDHPTNVVLIDREGRLRWNGNLVDLQRLGEFSGVQSTMEPPPILVIQPDRGAPCAMVRETISTALRLGRCTPQRCAFEWPDTMAPPLLPEQSKLVGNWILASIDGSPPPPRAYPIEIVFKEGEVGARSQCVSFAWLTGVEEGRLKLSVPNRPVAMCARGLSDWERRFQAAMASAGYIESAGDELIVTGPKGKLRLKRPG
jgi:heat shock protein HslJ